MKKNDLSFNAQYKYAAEGGVIVMKPPRIKPFFTFGGSAIIIIDVYILIRSLTARNGYEIILSTIIFLFLLILGIFGAWKARKLAAVEPGWKPPFPMTAGVSEENIITGMSADIPLFFRLHFIVSGKFFPASSTEGVYFFSQTSVPRKETQAPLKFNFPISGVFHGSGSCALRDIFGIFSFHCGLTLHKSVNVRSLPGFKAPFYINPQSGAEDRRNKTSSNEERYYMREYMPGDRFRDINWKSSEKINTLITRISPDNQEKVSRIEVHLRNYGPARASLESLWLLDRVKARLTQFLRSVKEEQESYIFDIRCAQGNWEVNDTDELDSFLEELSTLPFCNPGNERLIPQKSQGDVFVFSTACDIMLNTFLISSHPRPVSLFLVQPPVSKKDPSEIIHFTEFPAAGCIPPLRWLSPGKIEPVKAIANKTQVFYAEAKL